MDLLEIFSYLLILSFLLCRLLFLISCRLLLSIFSWAFDKIKYLPVTLGIIRNDPTPETPNNVGGESPSTSETLSSVTLNERAPETANNVGGESSSTSETLNSSPEWKYDVFLSFYGKDTRLTFTDHLYKALTEGGINAFRDNEGIERGEVISQQLRQAIKGSLCAVVVLSENYADSKWCLEELQLILECWRKLGQKVFPIFCDVDPSDIRNQKQNFGAALAKHEKESEQDKAQNWRDALFEIGSIAGWDTRGRQEAELIEVIVGEVSTYINAKLPSYDDNLVGIESRVRAMEKILEIGLDDKRVVGIWGMGGVGKTTLARVVYKKVSRRFDVCCFIENVRDTLQKEDLVSLQRELLSDLSINVKKISNQDKGKAMIIKYLSNKKVLLVLDDVDDMRPLKNLVGSPIWFGEGSRIIITTRYSHVLTSSRVKGIYEMKTMQEVESLLLFSNIVFNKDRPQKDYLMLSESVVKYAGGLPLALEVLGNFLCGRSIAEWKDTLDRLKKIPDNNILQVLETSYYGLNKVEKKIFLDIACFFKGWRKEEVIQILMSCDLHPTIGIKVLIEKALLVETKDCRLEMHDLIEEMGRYIVLQESPNDVCKRSRLWEFKDIEEVLENNKDSGEAEAIVMGDDHWNIIEVHPEAFLKMSRIRLLILKCPINAPAGLKKLSRALKFVRWPSFPLEALPVPLDELVHIDMPESKIKQLWNGIKSMNHLKFINLSASPNFTETPDFSTVQSLEHLRLSRCASLVKVHESLGMLKKLVEVDLRYCENLNILPSKLETNSLRKLDLGGCKNVKKLPQFGEGVKKLSYLDASDTAITSLPESLRSLTGLGWLKLSATGLINLPTDCFSSLFGLVFLSLVGCKRIVSLPWLPPWLIRLEVDSCYSMKQKDRTVETAYNVGGESSSTSNNLNSSPNCKYDVFLSFAGKDTRLNFTDHLYEAFIRRGIRCFMDDVDLPRGEDINDLFQAIQDSLCTILVISKSYAKSTWCLEELQKILESKKELGRRVFPIFYDVNPADVRKQRESFGEAFAELEKEFEEDTTKVQIWRTAFSNIANLSGWVIKDKLVADFIENIVEELWSFVSPKLPSCFNDNLVGIDSKVAELIQLLEIGLDDRRFVGIWGMGGVGKTTLARVAFEKLADKFEIFCFLANVKDVLPESLVSLQKSLLSCLRIKDLEIFDSYQGMQLIRRYLCTKKVLLVLDDVDYMSQLKDLAESPDWFGKGSRIIITTRDSYVVTSIGGERIYKMTTMNDEESLQLFSKKAFNKNLPEEKYLEYSKSVVKSAGGLPLALVALGSYFRGRSGEAVWRDALEKLKQINPRKDILEVLKISYDGLDAIEQTIFLDIVCLFKRWRKKEVTKILRACDLNSIFVIRVLIEKALLVETECGELDMHDLCEELGWSIIQQNSPNSRLRKFGEIKEVLENNKGSGEIEAIVMEDWPEDEYWPEVEVHPEAFSKMSRIRLLLLKCPVNVPRGLKKLSGALKFLRWPSFPLEALPLPLDDLVHIEMRESKIKQLWNGIKSMNHLKFIDLSGSPDFTETPDLSAVKSLEQLRLSRCASLVKVHESLGVLKKLVEVNLHDCESLSSLPSKLETNSLRMLDLGGCKNVKKLPKFGEGMKELFYVDASYTAITSLPESLGSLIGLGFLNLSGTGFVNLPIDCFSSLFGLVFLSLEGCKCLVSLPRLPPRLTRLEANGCYSMERSLDEQLLNLVTSLDHECHGQTKYVISDEGEEYLPLTGKEDFFMSDKDFEVELEDHALRNFIAIMPSGGKIPSWCDPNVKYYDKVRHECEIEVDVPPNICNSKWLRIVVCLHIKGSDGMICWSSKALEDDEHKGCAGLSHSIGKLYGGDGLCVMVLEFNQDTCWRHLRGDNNSLHILLSSHKCPAVMGGDPVILDILGYGWRVICKEDIQKWSNAKHFKQYTQPQHAPPSKVELPLGLLRRILGISVKHGPMRWN